jgi:hypothetical protein
MITIHVRIHDRVVDLSHLMMHRVKTLFAMIAVTVSGFKDVEHLFGYIKIDGIN